ncbi:MAG: hypothetical protein IPL55_03140 [Saprospiraceae bacterium]|jgi:hypothetical protein|nr:hypothetical protein [Saprospiraceae bacterium]
MAVENTYLSKEKFPEWLAITGVILLITGFLFNRVVNNLGAIIIGLYTLYKIKEILPLFKQRWMISIILLSVVPLLSDILTEGFGFYHERGIMKLSLILFPSFIFALKPNARSINNFMIFFLLVMLISTLYSLWHYIISYDNMYLTYKESRVVSTLSTGDHIRISWASVISCICAYYLYLKSTGIKKKIFILYILLQVIFIHILGSKTGLISLYLTFLLLISYSVYTNKKWVLILIVPLILIMPVIAYKSIPSFEQRINFIKYDYEHYIKGEYKEGLSDAVRYFSLLAGKEIIATHFWLGTGFSRLQYYTDEWYKKNIPDMGPENFFLPSSELMIYWASGGVLCLLIILFHILYPFFNSDLRKNMWFVSFFLPAVFSFMYETHLEGQLPLFLYGFFCAFFWYLTDYENREPKAILLNRP